MKSNPGPLPYAMRPLRPVIPGGRGDLSLPWLEQPFPTFRGWLSMILGEQDQQFAGWLAELYWRAHGNVWPTAPVSPGQIYRGITRCVVTGPDTGIETLLALTRKVLAEGPVRLAPESGEAVFTDACKGALRFQVRAVPEPMGAMRCLELEAPAFAAWMYEKGLERALATAATEQDINLRRLVNKTCGTEAREEEV